MRGTLNVVVMADTIALPSVEIAYLSDFEHKLDALDVAALDSLANGARDWTILVDKHWDELPESKRADLRRFADFVDEAVRVEGLARALFGGLWILLLGLVLRRSKTLRLARASARLSRLRYTIARRVRQERLSTSKILASPVDDEIVSAGHAELARGEGTTLSAEELVARTDGWR